MMYSRLKDFPGLPGARLITPERVVIISLVMMAVSYGVYAQSILGSKDWTLPQGPPVGGDFVAFWGAARAAITGLASDIYRPEAFEAVLQDVAMEREKFGLTWQYPPTYYLVILPLAAVPFFAGYLTWVAGTGAIFFTALQKSLGLRWPALVLIAALPVCFNAIITGQNGFLTAGLLVAAAALPDKRPILAGIAAGLLTIKPQLGILLPFAYLAAGCWRAFFAAALTAGAMVGASVGLFGIETWTAFLSGLAGVGDGVSRSVYPIHKMPTVFAALIKTGAPREVAMGVQALVALVTIGAVSIAWRRLKDRETRAAILCAGVFLCTPYAYYYEMTILVFPALVLIRRAMASRLLPAEEAGLAALWALPIFLPGMNQGITAQAWLCLVIGLIALLARRALPEMGFRSASAGSQAPAY